MSRLRSTVRVLAAVALAALAGCQSVGVTDPPEVRRGESGIPASTPRESVFGEGGIILFGGGGGSQADTGGALGVNSYLWRASLDTVSFLPLASADPFGGVILTDWYSPAETPSERFKVNVFILGRQLRADGIKATVFRQRRDLSGGWVDAAVEPRTSVDLENAILTRARQLRINTPTP